MPGACSCFWPNYLLPGCLSPHGQALLPGPSGTVPSSFPRDVLGLPHTTPGPELGQAPTCANLQSGMQTWHGEPACLGPWAILKEPEGLRGGLGFQPLAPGRMPRRFCDFQMCFGKSILKIYAEIFLPQLENELWVPVSTYTRHSILTVSFGIG